MAITSFDQLTSIADTIRGSYYVDLAVTISWTHGSTAFQILSDAVAHIVAKPGVRLHCYIDYYIVVSWLKLMRSFVMYVTF